MELIAPPTSPTSLRILLVEDSLDDAELLELVLCEQGYLPEIHRVETRAELQAALDQDGWQVLLCDHALPTFDAISALAVLKERNLDLPFIIVSNAIVESVAVEVMRAGAHDFLLKSSLGRLGAVIEREVREAKMRTESRRMQQQLMISDRLASIGMVAAGVAHEINNPLAYVLGNIQFALEQLEAMNGTGGVSPEMAELVEALQHAHEGSERIRVTTRDLKVFCRTDETAKTCVNVRKVMESSINMAWNEIRHRARLVRQFEVVPGIEGNENRLGQVFLNLLVNAAQALPERPLEQNEISVRIRASDGQVLIEIRDTGSGIAPAEQKRIFEPFYTTKASGVGTGIGLSICRSIVTELGGQIALESKLGEGTTFRIALPALTAVLSSIPPRVQPVAPRRARVLAIDDEAHLCKLIRRLLTPEHEVHTLGDARQGLELLQEDRSFDVIFCDLIMPRMSGMEFYGELSRTAPELARRTVFLTGGAFNSKARQFLSSVTNRVVEKPFSAQSLHGTIAQMLLADEPASAPEAWQSRASG
jgi:signal transduction histidine kinase